MKVPLELKTGDALLCRNHRRLLHAEREEGGSAMSPQVMNHPIGKMAMKAGSGAELRGGGRGWV